ncbi:MAG: GTPase Era [Chitinophagales bacterium]|nr:GTPase Era [Chitinophagales bacterium]MDW8427965.1 GTPase Era [Chitinophagales bacterium]
MTAFRAGFVAIIGLPNAGKSTLLNALVGEKVSIVSRRPQTTRHRILGIVHRETFQVAFVDTPGLLQPAYALHEHMMKALKHALEDADALLVLLDATQPIGQCRQLAEVTNSVKLPLVVAINKTDVADKQAIFSLQTEVYRYWPQAEVVPIAALIHHNLDVLLQDIVRHLPQHEPYFPGDQLTDRTERFRASELIREVIFQLFHEEIPYSTEVIITDWKEEEQKLRIAAEIWVERESQKGIVLGRGGSAIKQLGTQARQQLEQHYGKQVVLLLTVKVVEQWRKKKPLLKKLGYSQ